MHVKLINEIEGHVDEGRIDENYCNIQIMSVSTNMKKCVQNRTIKHITKK